MEGQEYQKISREQVAELEKQGLFVIDSEIPLPESGYRLRPCPCGCQEVAHLQVRTWDWDPWIVRCMGCGKRTDGFLRRHDAQLRWNMALAVPPKLGFAKEQDWYKNSSARAIPAERNKKFKEGME